MPRTYSSDELGELIVIAASHAAELELGDAGGRIADADNGDAILLTPGEVEVLEDADAGDQHAGETRAALERLGRIRLRQVLELARRPEDLTPEEAVDRAWQHVAAVLDGGTYSHKADGQDLAGLVRAYLDLRAHAGDGRRHAEDLEAARIDLRRLEGPAGAVIDEARALGADTFEGRLEVLGQRITTLGEAIR